VFGFPVVATHDDIRMLQIIEYQNCSNAVEYIQKPFPHSYDRLITMDLVRGFDHGCEIYAFFSTDKGLDILDNTPIRLLVNNLIAGMAFWLFERDEWAERIVIEEDRVLWDVVSFYMGKLSIEETPEFLSHKHPKINRLALDVRESLSGGRCV